jgi:mannobiose 2-epimerase
MNTNLHVLEAYTALYLASGRPEVREALEGLLKVFETRILVSPEHLGLYFDRDWTNLTTHQSYGHDIEASWLLTEAAQTLSGHDLPAARREVYVAIARKTLRLVQEHGALPNEFHQGHLDATRIWWVQAEALVGLVNAWELSGDEAYLEAAETVWTWIDEHQADREQGEWFWAVDANGIPDRSHPKGGLWKTSYHNGRACMEIIQRARRIP